MLTSQAVLCESDEVPAVKIVTTSTAWKVLQCSVPKGGFLLLA